MGTSSSAVKAGQAEVEVGLNDRPFDQRLTRAEARLKSFATKVVAIGASLAGFGVGLGVSLVGSIKSFANLGSELDAVTQKLTTVDKSSAEFARLTKEAERLTRIMGGADVAAAVKLARALLGLQEAVKGIVIKFVAGLAPALTSMVGYVTSAAGAVGKFLDQNKQLAPQAAVIVAALTAAGIVVAALGAAFFVLGPVIRLSMIVASAACMLLSAAMGAVSVSVAVMSAVVRVLSGVLWAAAAATKALVVVTALVNVALVAANVAFRAVSITIGLTMAAFKMLAIAIVGVTSVLALSVYGFKSLAGALSLLLRVKTVITAFSLLSGAIAFLASPVGVAVVAIGALVAIGVPLVAAFLRWTAAGQQMVAWLGDGFENLKAWAVQSFGGIIDAAGGVVGAISTQLSGIGTAVMGALSTGFQAAKKFFFDLLATGQTTFQGISDAVAAGDMQLAMDVLWAGIQVAWTQGCDAVKATWDGAMIYITGALDTVATNLKMIWDVAITYMEAAFDRLMLGVRNKMQDVSGSLAQWIAKTGVFGEVDEESMNEELQAQRDKINAGADQRAADRNKRLANAGDDAGLAQRAAERQKELEQIGKPNEKLAELQAQLAALVAKAAEQKSRATDAQVTAGTAGSEMANKIGDSLRTAAAQARNSSGAASTIASAVNRSLNNPNAKLETKADKTNQLLADINKKPGIAFVEVE